MAYTKSQVEEATLEYFDGDKLATNVFITKYCLKDENLEYVEKTPDDMHRRLAAEFARMEAKFGGENQMSEEEIYLLLKDFKNIVPQGSPMAGIGNNYVNVSLSNCVVVGSPKDNISSIVDAGTDLANLFKRRCGVGLDISNLRPENARVSNSAGTTTGAWSFADFYSYICRMVGQNGRRGALMITLDVRHPDVQQFITMKQDLTQVTGANVSIRITNDFMQAVESDEDYELHYPVGADTPTFVRTVKATEIWDQIVSSATTTAEPGILMWDNIVDNLPAHSYADVGFETICTNPCAEIPLSAYDSCRLISVNLKHMVDNAFEDTAFFNFDKFSDVVRKAMRLSDDLVELEMEKLKNIISIADETDEKELWEKLLRACAEGRRTGLGTHGLADAIARLEIAYDSDEAIAVISKIYSTFRDVSYEQSVELAKERGAFQVFNWETEKDNKYIKRLPQRIQDAIKKYGRRNISILTNAPTGSVSIMSQTSSGLEPVFRNVYVRRRKLSHNETHLTPDYIDDLGDKWLEYKVFHHNISEWARIKGLSSDEPLPPYFVESDSIDWKRRVEIQAAIQDNIDHAISSTINLPKGTKPALVGELYFQGWKKGLKGITVYVDGSRSGVLVTDKEEKEDFPYHSAPKRPKALDCDIHHITVKGKVWTILVGKLDNKPYEVMGGETEFIDLPKKFKTGTIIKNSWKTKQSRYDLQFGEDGLIKDIAKVFQNPNFSVQTRLVSLSMRHGAHPSFLSEQLRRDPDSDMFSFSRALSRVLKKYIEDGTKVSSTLVEECELKKCELVYQDGCATCVTCGYAQCG